MNYILSIYANRVSGVNNVELSSGGRVLKSYKGNFEGNNIKENILRYLHKGLRFASATVRHEDKLYIEIQNQHLVNWLMGRTEYTGYSELLDTVFADIESVDCQYKYLFDKSPRAKKATVGEHGNVAVENPCVGLDDLMEEFEG